MRVRLERVMFCVALMIMCCNLEVRGANHSGQDQHSYRAAFRYVITSNRIINTSGKIYRSVGVLLDEKAFSEEVLRELFRLLSKRFGKPRAMEIRVFTNLEQIPTPEESEAGAVSERPYDPSFDRYPSAIYIRQGEREFFRHTSNPPGIEMKTVILRCRDRQKP